MSLSHPSYRPDIDGLRAIAVTSVVIFHAFPELLPGGFIGVDIFFVISGYLISQIIISGILNDSFSLIDFYSRRVKRIFPALLTVLLSSFLIGWFVLLPEELKQLGKHITAGAGFASNLVLLIEGGYFDSNSEKKILLHLWSLGIEEQFYLIWPFILLISWRLRKNLYAVTFIFLFVSFILNVAYIHKSPQTVFYSPLTRFWELLCGASLASLHLIKLKQKIFNETITGTVRNSCSFMAITILVVAYSLIAADKRFPGWWALLPTLGSALVIASGPFAWLNRTILANRVLVWLGLISYPLYLWHWPLLAFARIMQNELPSVEIRLAVVALSILLAGLTYLFIEKPIRFHSKHQSCHSKFKNAVPLLLATLMVLVGYLGYNTYDRDGYRFLASLKSIDIQNNGFNWDEIDAYSKKANEQNNALKRDAILIGDSHALAYFGGFSEIFKKHNTQLQIQFVAACPPFFDIAVQYDGQKEHCGQVMNNYLNNAINSAEIKTIILTSRGPLYLTGKGYGDIDPITLSIRSIKNSNNSTLNSESNYEVTFENAFDITLQKLTSKNKKIFYIVDAAELGFEPESCVDSRPVQLIPNIKLICGVAKTDYQKRNSKYIEMISAMSFKYPSVTFLYPSKHLCDDKYCYAKKDGIIYYRDDDHISYAGSIALGKQFEREIFSP